MSSFVHYPPSLSPCSASCSSYQFYRGHGDAAEKILQRIARGNGVKVAHFILAPMTEEEAGSGAGRRNGEPRFLLSLTTSLACCWLTSGAASLWQRAARQPISVSLWQWEAGQPRLRPLHWHPALRTGGAPRHLAGVCGDRVSADGGCGCSIQTCAPPVPGRGLGRAEPALQLGHLPPHPANLLPDGPQLPQLPRAQGLGQQGPLPARPAATAASMARSLLRCENLNRRGPEEEEFIQLIEPHI